LVLVTPKADHRTGFARSRAMHGKGLLEKARVVRTLGEALEGMDFSAATTCKTTGEGKLTRTPVSPKEFAENYSKTNARLGLVFGPEGSGLTNREIELCDFLVSIPASHGYPTLNLGHAAAVVLYEIYCATASPRHGLSVMKGGEKKQLIKKFNDLVHAGGKIRNKAGVLAAFRALLSRSPVSAKEGRAIMGVFDGALRGLGKNSERKRIK